MQALIHKEGFIQINIVVADIEQAAGKWSKILGIPMPETHETELAGSEAYQYRNRQVSCQLKTCSIEMDGFVLELHQPVGGESTFQEFLDNYGNGVHHIGFEVGESRDAVIEELRRDGFDVERTVGYYPGSSWTIVDSTNELGVNLNIKPLR